MPPAAPCLSHSSSPDHARHGQGHARKLFASDGVAKERHAPQQHQYCLAVAQNLQDTRFAWCMSIYTLAMACE